MTERLDADGFVRWLQNVAWDDAARKKLTIDVVLETAKVIELQPSQRMLAADDHEKFISWIEAGFTAERAFALLLNDRQAMWQSAVREVHKSDNDE